ncbi:MAG: LL-diaminopimelate aminotransferase [Clostridiales bacterium]|jgi:LL-diaminopimelate aminotransferase|nr:LL-diaminopimelate aminotransferase [Clostridiales bacterium]
MKINENYNNLTESYLFSTIAQKHGAYKAAHPDKKVISLGIGDVTLPLAPAVTLAMEKAVAEMGVKATFRGYGDSQGYAFLREAVCGYYARKGVEISENDVFVSDGAKSDLGNILDIFDGGNTVLIPDPVYPAYVDANVMAGRRIIYTQGSEGNNFLPMPGGEKADIIYLCSPNNPTGAVYTREQLGEWVTYARKHGAIILFDSAYEAFVGGDDLPTSIYEIDGARECAIEFCSLSKTAGFTGTRCGYTIVPFETGLRNMWLRRQSTKFNGVPYIIQRGAEAVFTPEGQEQIKENIDYYMENAHTIARGLSKAGVWYVGGQNSPYIWMKIEDEVIKKSDYKSEGTSWAFFDFLLENAQIVGTPGVGFGKMGEGYFRLSSFGDRDDVIEAMDRMCKIL